MTLQCHLTEYIDWNFVNESKPIHFGLLKLRLTREKAREPSIYEKNVTKNQLSVICFHQENLSVNRTDLQALGEPILDPLAVKHLEKNTIRLLYFHGSMKIEIQFFVNFSFVKASRKRQNLLVCF